MSASILIGDHSMWDGSAGLQEELLWAIERELPSGTRHLRELLDIGRQTEIASFQELSPSELALVADAADRAAANSSLLPTVRGELRLLVASLRDDPRLAGASAQMAVGVYGAVRWRSRMGDRLLEHWLGAPQELRPRHAFSEGRVAVSGDAQWTGRSRNTGWRYREASGGSELAIEAWPGIGVVPASVIVELLNAAVILAPATAAAVHVLSTPERDEALAERRVDIERPNPDSTIVDVDLLAGLDAGVVYWRQFVPAWEPAPAGLTLHDAGRHGGWIQLTPRPPNDATYGAFKAAREALVSPAGDGQ